MRIINATVYDAVAYYLFNYRINLYCISKSLCYNQIKNKVCCKNKPPKLISLGGLFFIWLKVFFPYW
nr:MAG TPA: hypothetical protein [Caudoviricetes sp.]